jgi:hypothetical protein
VELVGEPEEELLAEEPEVELDGAPEVELLGAEREEAEVELLALDGEPELTATSSH